ncbi:MAG: folate family ECF transporter S component [Lachnospiraceae bacterium]|nr:folate family ECF transporter S component [Lachnospiraceae bacterium]
MVKAKNAANIANLGEARGSLGKQTVKLLSLMAILIALEFVTEYLLSITIGGSYRISLTFLIRAIAGFTIGPLGGIVAGCTDILGGFILYAGSMVYGITIVRVLQGATDGLFLYKKATPARIVLAALFDAVIWNIPCLYFKFTYFGIPYKMATVIPQVIISVCTFAVSIAAMMMLRNSLLPIIRKFMFNNGIWSAPAENKAETVSEVVEAAAEECSVSE